MTGRMQKSEGITSRYGSGFTPVLSKDGKWLVYGSRFEEKTGLVLRNLETGDEKWLAVPVQRDEQESIAPLGVLPAMVFSTDSKALLRFLRREKFIAYPSTVVPVQKFHSLQTLIWNWVRDSRSNIAVE